MIIEVIPSKNEELFLPGHSSVPDALVTSRHGAKHVGKWGKTWESTAKLWILNSLWYFFDSGFGFFFGLPFLVPCALYLQQFGTRICHFAWYLLHFGMITFHVAWYLLHLAMFALHFAWYLPRFGTSTSHLHGICYILVLQTFIWVLESFFRLSFSVSFRVSFRVSLGIQLGFHLGFL